MFMRCQTLLIFKELDHGTNAGQGDTGIRSGEHTNYFKPLQKAQLRAVKKSMTQFSNTGFWSQYISIS